MPPRKRRRSPSPPTPAPQTVPAEPAAAAAAAAAMAAGAAAAAADAAEARIQEQAEADAAAAEAAAAAAESCEGWNAADAHTPDGDSAARALAAADTAAAMVRYAELAERIDAVCDAQQQRQADAAFTGRIACLDPALSSAADRLAHYARLAERVHAVCDAWQARRDGFTCYPAVHSPSAFGSYWYAQPSHQAPSAQHPPPDWLDDTDALLLSLRARAVWPLPTRDVVHECVHRPDVLARAYRWLTAPADVMPLSHGTWTWDVVASSEAAAAAAAVPRPPLRDDTALLARALAGGTASSGSGYSSSAVQLSRLRPLLQLIAQYLTAPFVWSADASRCAPLLIVGGAPESLAGAAGVADVPAPRRAMASAQLTVWPVPRTARDAAFVSAAPVVRITDRWNGPLVTPIPRRSMWLAAGATRTFRESGGGDDVHAPVHEFAVQIQKGTRFRGATYTPAVFVGIALPLAVNFEPSAGLLGTALNGIFDVPNAHAKRSLERCWYGVNSRDTCMPQSPHAWPAGTVVRIALELVPPEQRDKQPRVLALELHGREADHTYGLRGGKGDGDGGDRRVGAWLHVTINHQHWPRLVAVPACVSALDCVPVVAFRTLPDADNDTGKPVAPELNSNSVAFI